MTRFDGVRILVAHNVRRSRNGGMSRIMGFIHDRLAEEGAIVDYLCSDDVPARYTGRWSRFAFPLAALARVRAAAAAGKPYDIVNIHEPVGAAVALWSRSHRGTRVVITSHGVEQRGWEVALADRSAHGGPPSRKTRVLYPLTVLWQARLALQLSDHVLCLSSQDRRYLDERMGITPDRVTHIFPAPDEVYAALAATRDYARGDRLLFFGTWLRRKGTEDTVRAFEQLAERHPSMTLTVMGGGFPPDVILGDFPEGLRHRVHVARTVTEQDVASVLANCDIVVMPSMFEGTPQALLECMAAGMPAITTDTSGMSDVVVNEKNGIFVRTRSPEDIVAAVTRLCGDEQLRRRLGRQGQADVTARYTWDRAAARVRASYDRLLEAR